MQGHMQPGNWHIGGGAAASGLEQTYSLYASSARYLGYRITMTIWQRDLRMKRAEHMPRCREILVMGPESYIGTDMNRWQLTVAMLRSSFSKTSPMVENAHEAACEGTKGFSEALKPLVIQNCSSCHPLRPDPIADITCCKTGIRCRLLCKEG
jgi:hypothetical protein